jgi:hypothetical protein
MLLIAPKHGKVPRDCINSISYTPQGKRNLPAKWSLTLTQPYYWHGSFIGIGASQRNTSRAFVLELQKCTIPDLLDFLLEIVIRINFEKAQNAPGSAYEGS